VTLAVELRQADRALERMIDLSTNPGCCGAARQGGVSTWAHEHRHCAIVSKLPELISTATTALPLGYCEMDFRRC